MHQQHSRNPTDVLVADTPEDGVTEGQCYQQELVQQSRLSAIDVPSSTSLQIFDPADETAVLGRRADPRDLSISTAPINALEYQYAPWSAIGCTAFHSNSEEPYHFDPSRHLIDNDYDEQSFVAGNDESLASFFPSRAPVGSFEHRVQNDYTATSLTVPRNQSFNQSPFSSTPTTADLTTAPTMSSETSPRFGSVHEPIRWTSGGEAMTRETSRISSTSIPTSILRSPLDNANARLREASLLVEASQTAAAPATPGIADAMLQRPTFGGFTTRSNLTVPPVRSPSEQSAVSAVTSISAPNLSFLAPPYESGHQRNEANGAVPITRRRPSYTRPSHQQVICPDCDDTFKGDHEYRRHKLREHCSTRVVWVARDGSRDGDFLAGCKDCDNGKKYNADYNLAAHLRRIHFHPCEKKRSSKGVSGSGRGAGDVVHDGENKSQQGSKKNRGGKAGGDDPPMSELKAKWMFKIIEEVGQDGNNNFAVGDAGLDHSATAGEEVVSVMSVDNSASGYGDVVKDDSGNSQSAQNNKRTGSGTSRGRSRGRGRGRGRARGRGRTRGRSRGGNMHVPSQGENTNTSSYYGRNEVNNAGNNGNNNSRLHRSDSSNDYALSTNGVGISFDERSATGDQQLQFPSTIADSSFADLSDDCTQSVISSMIDAGLSIFPDGDMVSEMLHEQPQEGQLQEEVLGAWSANATAGGELSQPLMGMGVDGVAANVAHVTVPAIAIAAASTSTPASASASLFVDAADAVVADNQLAQVGAGLFQDDFDLYGSS